MAMVCYSEIYIYMYTMCIPLVAELTHSLTSRCPCSWSFHILAQASLIIFENNIRFSMKHCLSRKRGCKIIFTQNRKLFSFSFQTLAKLCEGPDICTIFISYLDMYSKHTLKRKKECNVIMMENHLLDSYEEQYITNLRWFLVSTILRGK